MMTSTYAIAVRDDPQMKGDYTHTLASCALRCVRDDPQMKGDYTAGDIS